jgi:hypothetical protein
MWARRWHCGAVTDGTTASTITPCFGWPCQHQLQVTFSWFTCQPEKLNEVERAFIRDLQPICNYQNVTWII